MARGFITYRAYLFKTKDPVIDELRTIIQDETGDKRLGTKTLKAIEVDGGPRATTMRNWFRGETKRPQSATVEACGRALGYRRKWVKNSG
jgi:hypothetical protein